MDFELCKAKGCKSWVPVDFSQSHGRPPSTFQVKRFQGITPWVITPVITKSCQYVQSRYSQLRLWFALCEAWLFAIEIHSGSLYCYVPAVRQNDVQDTNDSTLDTCRSSTSCSTMRNDPYQLAMEFHFNNGMFIQRGVGCYNSVRFCCIVWWLPCVFLGVTRIRNPFFGIPHNFSVWPRMTFIVPCGHCKKIM